MIIYTTIWFYLYRGLEIKCLNKTTYENIRLGIVILLIVFPYAVELNLIYRKELGNPLACFATTVYGLLGIDSVILGHDLITWWTNNFTNFTFTNIACLWLPLIKEPGCY